MTGALRFLRWMGVTIWFGIWAGGISYLTYTGFNDPRDPFPYIMSIAGCVILLGGWIGTSAYYAIHDELPASWGQ